jgi:hypothetical protein
MSYRVFDLSSFIKESVEVIAYPKAFFSALKTTGGLTEPLIKVLIYGAVTGAMAAVLTAFHFAVGGDILIGFSGFKALSATIIGAVIGLFAGSLGLLVISSVCKGSTDFESCCRIVAAVMVLVPVGALLGLITNFSFYPGEFIVLCIKLFGLWLVYNALIEKLKAKQETTRIVIYIIGILVILFKIIDLSR